MVTSRVLNTVAAKGKSTERTMRYMVQNMFRKGEEKHLYTLGGAPAHMHASVCLALTLLLFFMYISPPNCTPYCQGCDKVHINKAFGTFLEDFFTEWLGTALEGSGPRAKAPTPTRHQMATWIRDSWEKITDEALKSATVAAYFPDGLKFSPLLDTAYFGDETVTLYQILNLQGPAMMKMPMMTMMDPLLRGPPLMGPPLMGPPLMGAAKRGKQAAAASASIPVADGEHVQLFKTLWDRKRKFYTVPVQNKGHAQN